jgi:hypothetical protein
MKEQQFNNQSDFTPFPATGKQKGGASFGGLVN